MNRQQKASKHANYFPNFYGFRLIAALAVVVLHIQLMAGRFGWVSSELGTGMKALSLGVDFFFVLSGFLITALIVFGSNRRTFSLPRYYLKRGLRILPLYYLVVFVVFFGVNLLHIPEIAGMPLEKNFGEQLTLHLVLLPQVEVMFYLFWPLLLLGRRPILTTAVFAGLNVLIKIVALLSLGAAHPFCKFLAMSRFEVLAIGGLAYLCWQYVAYGEGAGHKRVRH